MSIRRANRTLLAFVLLWVTVIACIGAEEASAATSRVAVIKELKGAVKVKKAGGSKEFTAFAKMSLNEGDVLATGEGATVVLQFANGTKEDDKMTVSSNTKLTFSKLSDKRGTTTKVSMYQGSVWVDVRSISTSNDEFTLETPTAVMGVRGTHLLVSVDPATGDTRLTVAAGVVRTETKVSGGGREEDVYPTQRAIITGDEEERQGDIYIAPVDLSLLMSQSDANIVSAILGSAADIVDENADYAERYEEEGLPEQLGDSAADLARFKANTEHLLGAIADQAVKDGLLTQARLEQIVEEVKQQSGLTLDLTKKTLEVTSEEKRTQEDQLRLEEERKQRAEELRRQEQERRLAGEALAKQLEEEKKRQAEANRKAGEDRKKKALEAYESRLTEAEKLAFEQEKKRREAELSGASAPPPSTPSTPSTPPPSTPPVPSDDATLSDLRVNGTTIAGFSAGETDYLLPVSAETYSLSISPFAAAGATVTVAGHSVSSGAARNVSLKAPGLDTFIAVVVTAENGANKKTYTIAARRAAVPPPVNMPPTDIVLTSPIVTEESPVGTFFSGISAADPDSGPPFVYELVSGVGDDDNGSFSIAFDNDYGVYRLAVNARIDYETQPIYSIRLRATDSQGASFEKALQIEAWNVNEPPTAIEVAGLTVSEDEPLSGSLAPYVGDPDANATLAYVWQPPSFGTVTIESDGSFEYMPNANYVGADSFLYKVSDGQAYSDYATVSITVLPIDDAPTNLVLSNESFAENIAIGSIIGQFSAVDPDDGDTFTYELVAGTGGQDNGAFAVVGNELSSTSAFNYETKSNYSIRVRVTDSDGLTFERAFALVVADANESPTNIALDDASFYDYTTGGTEIGTLSATGGTGLIAYTLVTGSGDDDNGMFAISESRLRTSASYDDGFKGNYHIRVKASSYEGSYEKSLTISTSNSFVYSDILSYAGNDKITSTAFSSTGIVRVNGHEFIGSLSSAALGYQVAFRADVSRATSVYVNGSASPLAPVGGRYYFDIVSGWNEVVSQVEGPGGVEGEYAFHIWVGDAPPDSMALTGIQAKDNGASLVSTGVDGINPLVWYAQVQPGASYVDISAQFADEDTEVRRVVLKEGQEAEKVGTLPNGYRIPFAGMATYAFIHAVDEDGNSFVYKLIVGTESIDVGLSDVKLIGRIWAGYSVEKPLSLIAGTATYVMAYGLESGGHSPYMLSVKPIANDYNQTIRVNGETVGSGGTSTWTSFSTTEQAVNVEVTAQSGRKAKYTINATRPLSNTTALSHLTLSGIPLTFSNATLSYSLGVAVGVNSTTVSAPAIDSRTQVWINGVKSTSRTFDLSILSTLTITIEVVAESGATQTYEVFITRLLV
ncbi:cadherin-like beta sandwich domain-containing protein [Cohnella sp. GCM10027633]|uniref:cadherin-like beta sandwich domain-containing protein n=1 Tax=unclassified Cohnella TaxID=2636738 RepID=UPI003670B433